MLVVDFKEVLELTRLRFPWLQTAEIELQAKQQLCNELGDCSSQLLQETASAPNFNATALTDQVHGLQRGWKDSAKVRRS